jgi:carbonic anhydrase
MSVFSKTDTWPAGCSSANQSPIDLQQEVAKPCNLSCDLVMDNGNVSQAEVSISNEGLILQSSGGLGSCKYAGQSYLCVAVSINHPAHHTINGLQADAEATAIFRKDTGEMMCMSSLIKLNNTQTPSFSFFKQFVPYANTTDSTKLTMRDWSISAMVPPDASYFLYDGSTLIPPCTPCKWIVFKQMINMDEGDFSYLVRNVQPGSRSIQSLGNREVFFNDINNIPGGPVPHDNKLYLRLRPTGNTQINKPRPRSIDLKNNTGLTDGEKDDEYDNPSSFAGSFIKSKDTYIKEYGWIGLIAAIISVIGVCAGIYYGYEKAAKSTPITGEIVVPWAIKTRSTFWWLVVSMWNFSVSVFTWCYNIGVEIAQGIYRFFIKGELAVADSEAAVDAAAKAGEQMANAAGESAKLAQRLTQLEEAKLDQLGTNSS